MSNRFWQKPRRVTAGIVAGAIASMAALAASPAGALITTNYPPNADGDTIRRVSGFDRYDTSVAIAGEYGAPGTSAVTDNCSTATVNPTGPVTTAGPGKVVIASGDNFPDALAASAYAGSITAPIVLVPKDGTLPQSVKNYISTGCVPTIVGGEAAVSAAMAAQIATEAGTTPTRLSGADRYQTSRAIAAKIGSAKTGLAPDLTAGATIPTLRTAIVVSGENFPDALAAGPLASGGFVPGSNTVHPVVLTAKDALPAASLDALFAVGAQQVIVLGGPAAVSDAVLNTIKTAVPAKVLRVAGADRFATAAALAGVLYTTTFSSANVAMANFVNFPDALSAGPLLGKARAAIVGSGSVPQSTVGALNAIAPKLGQTLWVFGGTAAVTDADAATGLAALAKASAGTLDAVSATGRSSATASASAVNAGLTLTATGSLAGAAGNGTKIELAVNPLQGSTVVVTSPGTAGSLFKISVTNPASASGADIQAAIAAAGITTVVATTSPSTAASNFVPGVATLAGGTSDIIVTVLFNTVVSTATASSFVYQATTGATPVTGGSLTLATGASSVAVTFVNAPALVPSVSRVTVNPGGATGTNGSVITTADIVTIS